MLSQLLRWLKLHFNLGSNSQAPRPAKKDFRLSSFVLRHVLFVPLVLSLAGCSAGMVLGTGATCTVSTALLTQVIGECTRTIEELTETENEGIAVSTADIAPFTTVDWELTVESGRVAVIFTDFRGNAQTTEVTYTNPGSGSTRIQLDPINRINFKIEPLDGPAQGVEYKLKFVCDCMP